MNMGSNYHVRSISFPSRSHPNAISIEEELSKLKTREESSRLLSSASICSSLLGLEELYVCMVDLLNMASTQEVLSRNQQEKCIDEILDGSVKLLDICGITRDSMLQIKEHVQALHSALRRRRKGDSSIENSTASYNCFRKKMKKEAKKMILTLKQMDNKLGVSPLPGEDHHLAAVIRVLKEFNAISSYIFQSVLLFLSAPGSRPKQSRWALVSKLMQKGTIACEQKQETVNELESVDIALFNYDIEKMQNMQTSLKALESCIEGLEKNLESMFRRLIRTRASLLNIISQ